jgi:hypothetical protein
MDLSVWRVVGDSVDGSRIVVKVYPITFKRSQRAVVEDVTSL